VDDLFDRIQDEILEKLRTVTGQPIKYLLNHSSGNAKMLALNAHVISHRNARAKMALLKQPGFAPAAAP
jgi:hypothetical protein